MYKSKYPSLVGKAFGRLIVLEELPTKPDDNYAKWVKVRCSCGVVKLVRAPQLPKSCGCLRRERMATLSKPGRPGTRTTHGRSRTKLYGIWASMIRRCRDPKSINYKNYGGRGITVCKRWLRFENFLADMGERPTERHCVERKDNSKGYSPNNCCWATYSEQRNNTRTNRLITIDGVTKTMTQWARENGLYTDLVSQRINQRGWCPIKAVTTPARAYRT